MTYSKTNIALLALLTLAACKKNDREMINNEVEKTSVSQKPNLLTEATQIIPFWDRSETTTAGSKGKLTIVPFDESKLYKKDEIQRRMLVLNDDKANATYIEVYSLNKIPDDNLNRVISNFISNDKTVAQRMIEDFEGTIMIYDKNRKSMGGFTYNKKYLKPGAATLTLEQNNARVAPPEDETCYYVVLTTTYTQYFSDGSIFTWSDSQIVGYYCSGDGSTTGGGGSNECSSNALANFGFPVSEFQGASLVSEGPEYRTKNYKWTIFRSNPQILPDNIWWVNSHETGVHKKVGGIWKWHSLTHNSISKEGTFAGGTVDCEVNRWTPTLGIYWAMMALNFNIKYSIVCKGFPGSWASDFKKAANFHVDYDDPNAKSS